MKVASESTSVCGERLIIAALGTLYLVVFNRTVPHGDALRIVRQIEDGQLIWNPNHLLFDPLGYGWFALLQKLGIRISALDSFELISGTAAVSTLLIFHALLLKIGVNGWGVRALAVGGLFASQGFLSMAISQYYFMIQMPFLIGILYLAADFVSKEKSGYVCSRCLYGMGVLSAIAAAITFNNVFLVISLGLVAGCTVDGRLSWNVRTAARVWGAAAALGLPIFIFGYFASATMADFVSWLLSYQGDSQTKLNEFYGTEWTLKGAVVSLGRAGFHLVAGSTIETAGMGTAIKAILLREPLEFVPELGKLFLALALVPAISGTLIVLFFWAARRLWRDRLAMFVLAWIGAYLLFNVLWSSSADQFWFQILPATWLLLMTYLGEGTGVPSEWNGENWGQKRWKLWILALTVPALLAVNTLQTVVPVSLVDFEVRRAEHMALLRDGDLEIVPGWDDTSWMELDPSGPRVERIALMDMALQERASDGHIQHLPSRVASHLAGEGRVVVARLFDKDHGINPWYGLSRLGWPRAEIQVLLSGFCQRHIGEVGDVVFREVYVCRQ